MTMCSQGGSEIGKANRLRPNRCSIKIPNGRLNKEDLHFIDNELSISYCKVKPIGQKRKEVTCYSAPGRQK
jgi:hypothetical protein